MCSPAYALLIFTFFFHVVCFGLLTINEHHGLFNGMLVAKLGVEERSADKRAVVGGLVPAHMQMVDVDVTQGTHHLHLVLD